jgi:hypothetical protein
VQRLKAEKSKQTMVRRDVRPVSNGGLPLCVDGFVFGFIVVLSGFVLVVAVGWVFVLPAESLESRNSR